jgi:polyhydroxybutyrate depolymerase
MMIAYKLGRVTVAIFFVLLALPLARRSFGNSQGSITVDGHERTYEVHAPASYKGEQAVPLVLALHGRSGTGHGMAEQTHFDSVSDAHGFLVAYPDGLQNSWADGHIGLTQESLCESE